MQASAPERTSEQDSQDELRSYLVNLKEKKDYKGSEIAATDGIKKYAHPTIEQHQAWASSVCKKLAAH
eukprot:3910681-Rhodomonas_salina.1